MEREVNKNILIEWAKSRANPKLELAVVSGVSPATIYKVFGGYCPGNEKIRKRLSAAIGVDTDELFPKQAAA